MCCLTCADQDGNKGMSSAVKREIMQGLLEGHGADKGVTFTFFDCYEFCDFETCEEIDFACSGVRFLV